MGRGEVPAADIPARLRRLAPEGVPYRSINGLESWRVDEVLHSPLLPSLAASPGVRGATVKRALREAGPEGDLRPRRAKRPVRKSTTLRSEIGDDVRVRLSAEPPSLPRVTSRTLLAILVELTDVPVLDMPEGRGTE
jgi:hypothetical protein